jgi:hypothetical protein
MSFLALFLPQNATGRERYVISRSVVWLLLIFSQQDSATAVGAAFGADPMRQVLAVALGALHQARLADGIVGAATIAATLGNLTFWQRGHSFLLLS